MMMRLLRAIFARRWCRLGDHSDLLAAAADLAEVNGWQAGAPFTQGTQNFEVMREWNRSEVYRRTLVYFAQQLSQRRRRH